MVFVADDVVEQSLVRGSAHFFKRTEVRRGKVAARTATDGRFYALSVGHVGVQALDAYCSLAMTTVRVRSPDPVSIGGARIFSWGALFSSKKLSTFFSCRLLKVLAN